MKLQHIARGAPPHLFILALFVSCFGAACNFDPIDDDPLVKEPPAGRVLEFGTDKPIEDALVYLQDCEGGPLGTVATCKLIDTVYSVSGGNYEFTTSGDRVNAQKEGYFSDFLSEVSVNVGTEKSTVIHLIPHAWLRVTLKNESGAYVIYVPSAGLNNGTYHLEKGEEASFVALSKGNTEKNFIFSVYPEENGPIQSLDSVKIVQGNGSLIIPNYENSSAPRFGLFLPGHDTTDITIIY